MSDTEEQEFEEIFGNDGVGGEDHSSVDDEDADEFFSDIEEDERGDTTSAHKATVTVSGKAYAVGLFWKSSDDPKRVAKEAVAYSKSDAIGADLYCVRVGEAIQFGLGQKDRGHKPGMPSLAASIDEALTGDWLAAFYVGGSYYVAAVRKGLVLSEHDQIYVIEDDAKSVFTELYYGADWEEVICPASWGLSEEEAREERLEDIIAGVTSGKLKPTNPAAGLLKFGLVIAVLGAIGFGGYTFYADYQEKQRLAAIAAAREAAEQAQMQNPQSIGDRARAEVEKALAAVEDTVAPILGIERKQPEQAPDTPPSPPWEGRRNGTGMLIACVQDIMKAPMDVPGWETTQVTCTEHNVQVSLQRRSGTPLWAEQHLRNKGFPDVNFRRNSGSQNLFVSYVTSYVSVHGENIETAPAEEVADYVREHFTELFAPVDVIIQPDDQNNRVSRFFREGRINFDTATRPDEFATLFSKIKGFTVDSISLDVPGMRWSVRGTFYERRRTPLPRPAQR